MEKENDFNYLREHIFWRYKNTFILLISIIFLIFFLDSPFIKNIIDSVLKLGYLGAFLVGIFFVSSFSVVPASIVLFFLAKELDPVNIAFATGLGAVVGDYLIFRFLKDYVFEELRPFFRKIKNFLFPRFKLNPYFFWIIPILGAIIIASPFPDEIGIGLMGLSKIKNWQFLLLSFILNSLGILLMLLFFKSI
jgi:uncharacterized membrane protein YdjX (TVP38/TMEM64 family)